MKELSHSLTKKDIRASKDEWERLVKRLDTTSILRASQREYSSWAYFNHKRLFEIAVEYQLDLATVNGFAEAREIGLVDGRGLINPRDEELSYMYSGSEILHLYYYTKSVLDVVLGSLSVLNISDHLDRGDLLPLLATGDHVYVQGKHFFRPINKRRTGREQITQGRRRANGVEIAFVFDRWEATSTSAWACWLAGTQVAGSLIQIRSVDRRDGVLVLSGTALAISNGFQDMKRRSYENGAAQPAGQAFFSDDDEDDDFLSGIEEITD